MSGCLKRQPFFDRAQRCYRRQCRERDNFSEGASTQSGIGLFGEKLLYHFGTFPVPLWAKYCTTLRKVRYHFEVYCYRFARKHGIFGVRPREMVLHLWYVPQICDTIVRSIFDQICHETILVKNDGIDPRKKTRTGMFLVRVF